MSAHTFRVTGHVQGVGFRWSAQEEAQRLGLAGWVSNTDDGSLTGLVQGSDEAVEAFGAWLGQGPQGAKVKTVEWGETAATGLRIFTIR